MNKYTNTVLKLALSEGTDGIDAYAYFRWTWGIGEEQARIAEQEYKQQSM